MPLLLYAFRHTRALGVARDDGGRRKGTIPDLLYNIHALHGFVHRPRHRFSTGCESALRTSPPKTKPKPNQNQMLTLTLTLMLTHCAAGGPPTGTVVILPAWRQLQQWVVPLLQKPRLANLVLP